MRSKRCSIPASIAETVTQNCGKERFSPQGGGGLTTRRPSLRLSASAVKGPKTFHFNFPRRSTKMTTMPAKEKIIVALDVPSAEAALQVAQKLHGHVGMFKVGTEVFTAEGPVVARYLVADGRTGLSRSQVPRYSQYGPRRRAPGGDAGSKPADGPRLRRAQDDGGRRGRCPRRREGKRRGAAHAGAGGHGPHQPRRGGLGGSGIPRLSGRSRGPAGAARAGRRARMAWWRRRAKLPSFGKRVAPTS